jgi:predicted membrane channel-forming protein YqfA (hemolysin III family)
VEPLLFLRMKRLLLEATVEMLPCESSVAIASYFYEVVETKEERQLRILIYLVLKDG